VTRAIEAKSTDKAAADQAKIDRLTQQVDQLNLSLEALKKSTAPGRSPRRRARPIR
jgi:hypothetical protein